MLNFLGIGAQKSGTTWLYEMLSRHPGIAFPAGKEVHFWDAAYARGLPWYAALFPEAPLRLNGEITPAYALLASELIAEIKQAYPNLRLLYLLRNPLQRAWSAALMALGRAEMTLDEASDAWFIDHFRSAGSLRRGDYATCLENWRAHYAEAQCRVYFYEQIRDDPAALLGSCCDFLGLEREPFLSDCLMHMRQKVFAGPGAALRPSLLPTLREIYYPKIERLSGLLSQDLSHWKI